jgi:hypothetical protein
VTFNFDEVSEKLTPIGLAAVEYARRGWHVIPLHGVSEDGRCTCSRGSACNGPGKHPRSLRWQQAATANVEFVAGLWSRYGEEANVGIVAGPSGLVIVDIDGANGLDRFGEVAGGAFETPFIVKTGRGWHLYFSADAENSLRPQAGDGLDLRAGHSFVVAPPSRHRDGGRYEWQ